MKLKTAVSAHAALLEIIAADKANKFILASSTRIKLAMNLRLVRPLVDECTKEGDELLRSLKTAHVVNGAIQIPNRIKDEGGKDVLNPELAPFLAKQKEMEESEHDIAFSPIKVSDLGENQVPIDLIASLLDAGLLIDAPANPAKSAA